MTSELHYLRAKNVVYAVDPSIPPQLIVSTPAEVIVETLDARGGRLRRPEDVELTAPDYRDKFPKANPATGPIAVEGADPGDVLTVEILAIELDDRGYTLVKPGFGVIQNMVERPVARICKIIDNKVQFGSYRLPIRPMIGVVATAPECEPRGTAYVGQHGGNLDCNLVAVGSKIHLPVRAKGGLLFIGDVHATMGDGEVSGSGFEVGARVRIRLTLMKGGAIEWPWLETGDLLVSLASGTTFDEASGIAVRAMLGLLVMRYGLSETDAYMLASICGDLRVNQACRSPVDVSVRFEFPKLAPVG